jgi:hypothetical protein
MSKSKEMFTEERELNQDHDSYLDDSYRSELWMSQIKEKKNHTQTSAVDVLNDLFKSYGEIFSPKNKIE